ncbi:holin [Peribacillus sp. TH24]|nr:MULTISPECIES: holin [unclassified Peribacillus]MBK5446074.1 holin [Peribacillus sp. TH24]MBK5497406.1 holin [Peribacillus sp. TH14]WMX58314.1 holin [Peribacillus sp. R9-11]
MQQVLIFTTLLVPIVTAVVQVVKSTVTLPNNVLPILSLVVGLGIGSVAFPFTDMDIVLRLWAGAFAGLGGTGLYEVFNNRIGTTK